MGGRLKIDKVIKHISSEFFNKKKFTVPRELKQAHKISNALKLIEQKWPDVCITNNENDRPIFIFSAGWRSGSTLVQRLVTSSGEVVIWGEPLGRAATIPRLALTLTALDTDWPPDDFFDNQTILKDLSNKWIANLTPPISNFRDAHRQLLIHWLGVPAKENYRTERWGLKEVRLTIHHARYLKWLFPNSRFIFVYRSLFDAYRSWKGNLWNGGAWPPYSSWSPIVFAQHWKLLLEGFLEGYKEVDGVLVKFEDLISGVVDLNKIANHIQVKKLSPSVLKVKIRSYAKFTKEPKKKRLMLIERLFLRITAGSLLKTVGY